MSTFVLVHGAWHGGWCWYKVVSLLRQQGHTVLAPDLPAHGRDQTPINSVSMGSYAQRVADVMRTVGEPVILVGHSMGGFVISAAAEQQPESVAKLVYLAAFLLDDGQTFGDAASRDTGSTVSSGLVPSPDGASLTIASIGSRTSFTAIVPTPMWRSPNWRSGQSPAPRSVRRCASPRSAGDASLACTSNAQRIARYRSRRSARWSSGCPVRR